jgi:hypothetical protein
MPRRPRLARRPPAAHLVGLAAAFVLLAGASGCARKIGDRCTTNVECSPTGDRVCDPSQPDGYCTQEDCLAGTCPVKEAVCVRFVALTSIACYAEDGSYQCQRDDICIEGFCAPLRTERRACLAVCDDNADCRQGYQCVHDGVGGSQLVDMDNPDQRFCVPSTQTPVVPPTLPQ